jgi:transcriptional regulator with XRE-family HTH domain
VAAPAVPHTSERVDVIDNEIHRRLATIGEVLRAARRGRLSVERLAARAQVSSGLISLLERGKGNPSVAVLLRLASALNLSLGDLLDASAIGSTVYMPPGGRPLWIPEFGLTVDLMVPNLRRSIAVTRQHLPPGWNHLPTPLVAYQGLAFVHVLDGALDLLIDSATFAMRNGVIWRNPSRLYSETLSVFVPAAQEGVEPLMRPIEPNGSVSRKTQIEAVGNLIREARRGRYSIEELARVAKVSRGSIQRLERGSGNPSFSTLARVGRALGLPLSALFESPDDGGVFIVKGNERRRLVMPHDGLEYQLLVPNLGHTMASLRTVVPPGFDNKDQPFQHDGEEFTMVLRGRLEAHVDGDQYSMEAGSTLIYQAAKPHWFRNPSKSPTELFGVVAPPVF